MSTIISGGRQMNTSPVCRNSREKRNFTLIELLVSAACKTGVLYNRCGMLSWWGGALKTDKNGQKRTKTDKNGQKRTKTDKNGQKRISVRRRNRR